MTECGGINRGEIPRVPQALGDVPEVDPDTRGQKNPISTSTDKILALVQFLMDKTTEPFLKEVTVHGN